MNIIIAGAGKVGAALCRDLAAGSHRIMLIEQNEDRLEEMVSSCDISGIAGNGAAYDIQKEAAADSCDIFIAVMESDETNLVAAFTARQLGARRTIARVRNPEYASNIEFWRAHMGLSLLINPDLEAAAAIRRMILYPTASSVESFGRGHVDMAEILVRPDAPMAGLPLMNYRGRFGKVILCVIVRGGKVMIPNGSSVIQAGDIVTVTGEAPEVHQFSKLAHGGPDRIGSVLIIGGGRISSYLTAWLLKMRVRVKIIEIRKDIADRLAEEFPQAEVSLGDGTEHHFLSQERMQDYDAVISLTGIDEENILLSMYASRIGIKKCITKVNRTEILKILDNVGLESVVTPYHISINHIMRFIRSEENSEGSQIDAFYRLADDRVEVLQFKVRSASRAAGIPLKDLNLKKGVIVAAIHRGGRLFFPNGESLIQPGDEVIVATTNKGFQDLDDMVTGRRGHA